MSLVSSVPATTLAWGIALPVIDELTEVPNMDAPDDDQFIWFSLDVQPSQAAGDSEMPFGRPTGVAQDGAARYGSLPGISLTWPAIGINRTANGQLPAAAAPGLPAYTGNPTVDGILMLIEKALFEFNGQCWICWKRTTFYDPETDSYIDPATLTEAEKWFKDVCFVLPPKVLQGGYGGIAFLDFTLQFYGMGLAGKLLDPDGDYAGGDPNPAPDAPGLTGNGYVGGLGVGGFGEGGF